MTEGAHSPRRINWANTITVLSAAILIGTVITGTGLATGWAIASWLGVGGIGTIVVEALFVAVAAAVVVTFVRFASTIEPFVER